MSKTMAGANSWAVEPEPTTVSATSARTAPARLDRFIMIGAPLYVCSGPGRHDPARFYPSVSSAARVEERPGCAGAFPSGLGGVGGHVGAPHLHGRRGSRSARAVPGRFRALGGVG